MKTYVATTGVVFGLIAAAHVVRVVAEGPAVAGDPVFVALTVAAAALCAWAVHLLRRWPRV